MKSTPARFIQLLTVIGCLVLCCPIFGQRSDFQFHHIGLKEGLSEVTNEFVYQDLEGFIWIGSVSGLNRYDGARVKKYLWNLQDSTSIYGENVQSTFFEPDTSGFWFCTYEGINFYERAKDEFRHYFVYDTTGKELIGYHAFYLDAQHNFGYWQEKNKSSHLIFIPMKLQRLPISLSMHNGQ